MTLAAPSLPPQPLPPLDHVGRIAAVRNSLAVHEVDVVVVTRLVNVRYLSGFSGSHGVLVIAAQAPDFGRTQKTNHVDSVIGAYCHPT